ncbi:hypothetical protein TNIN_200381 [Trichonephila inaurata madagascariensis]|uniref:DUF4817 domain-containing protein n=2 Tax=Trichonephila inaurata madagascariensis TaxID=2747483 RepID=A0A8X6XJT0_9ARAC|nr:hypothetical protein TNIN_200381 [Trichonephila inaurata madagascariensis]
MEQNISPLYSTKQCIKIIEFFYSCQRSIVMTKLKYRQYLNLRSAPTAFIIRSLVGRFKELGSVVDSPGRGAHQNIRTEDNVETVLQIINQSQLIVVPANWATPERHCVEFLSCGQWRSRI